MKTKWIVKMTVPPYVNPYPNDFFPRIYNTREEADRMMYEITDQGGKAEVTCARGLAAVRKALGL